MAYQQAKLKRHWLLVGKAAIFFSATSLSLICAWAKDVAGKKGARFSLLSRCCYTPKPEYGVPTTA